MNKLLLKKEIIIKKIINTKLHFNILPINTISLIKFKEGGAPIFKVIKINQTKFKEGKIINKPFNIIKLRVKNRSYIKLAKQNNPLEHKP